MIISSVEEAIKTVEEYDGEPQQFQLHVSESLSFKGNTIDFGMAMAIITDKILAAGMMPDGYEKQGEGRIYKYKALE